MWPLILVAGVGAISFAFMSGSKPPGVFVGENCSSVQITDLAAYSKWIEPKLKNLSKKILPDMPAKVAIQKIMKTMFPGCSWAIDGTFDTIIKTPDGQVDTIWSELLAAVGEQTVAQAITSGSLMSFVPEVPEMQGAPAVLTHPVYAVSRLSMG